MGTVRERKAKLYFGRVANALEKHEIVSRRIMWEDSTPEARGLRALIHAFREPAIAWDPQMELALKRVVERVEADPDFARTFYVLARRFGRSIPKGWPPEAKIAQISEIPIGRIRPDDLPSRPPRTKDGQLKYFLVKTVAELTRAAHRRGRK